MVNGITVGRVGWGELLKNIEVNLDRVSFLTRSGLELRQCREDLPVICSRLVNVGARLGFKIAVLLLDAAVGPVAVIVGRVVGRRIREDEDASARSVTAEEEIVTEVHVG